METVSYDKEQIRERVSVKNLYEKEISPLKRSGSNWVGMCPFHEEKSGSFAIKMSDEDTGHCFGCGWHGDVFDFWGGIRNVDFVEAIRQLGGLTMHNPRVVVFGGLLSDDECDALVDAARDRKSVV